MKTKVLALVVCLAMVMCAIPMMGFAAPTLEIGTITKSAAVDGLVTITVPYSATDIDQVTILGTIGGAEAPDTATLSEADIGYIDQQAAETTIMIGGVATTAFQFVVDETKFSTETAKLYIKMGGTALETAQSGDPLVILSDEVEIMYGDVNGDKVVNASDASLVLQRFVGTLLEFPAGADTVGDVNADGFVNASDASLILQYFVGTLLEFPASSK